MADPGTYVARRTTYALSSRSGRSTGARRTTALFGPSAKLPFEIVPADRQPDRNALRLARAFDLFECSGAAWVLGSLFVFVLALLRRATEALGVDLSHLNQEAKKMKVKAKQD